MAVQRIIALTKKKPKEKFIKLSLKHNYFITGILTIILLL